MNEFMAENGGLLATILLIVGCLNLVLSGLSKAIDTIKDKTKSDLDNKISKVLIVVLNVLQKILDWASGNREHKK